MTDLTEQWKNRKLRLPIGEYYVLHISWCEVITKLYYDGCMFFSGDVPIESNEIKEVLAPVPRYEEWQAKLEENAQLKEQINHLLKTQARQFVDNQKLQVKAKKAKDVVNIDTARQIKQLKELLKEWVQFEIEENPNDFTVMSERMSELANKTKEVLK